MKKEKGRGRKDPAKLDEVRAEVSSRADPYTGPQFLPPNPPTATMSTGWGGVIFYIPFAAL